MSYSPRDRDAIRSMLRRASVVAVDDSGGQQLVDVSGFAGDRPRAIARAESFGFASNPPPGGNGLILCPGGRSDRAMFVGGEHPQYRPGGLPVGGTTIYDANGQAISFVQNNIRVVGSGTITIEAPTINLVGQVNLGAATGTTFVSLTGGHTATKVKAI